MVRPFYKLRTHHEWLNLMAVIWWATALTLRRGCFAIIGNGLPTYGD